MKFQRQPDDPNRHPIGHDGYCCDGCIDESNAGYSSLDRETCCCRDQRDFETRDAEYAAWLARVADGLQDG